MTEMAALRDGPPEETSCAGHRQQGSDTHGPIRLAEDGDVLGVTAEGGDVLAHPFQGGDLVEQAAIGHSAVQVEDAVHAEAVVDSDADHAVAGEAATIV